MNRKITTKELVMTALLIAFGVVIPTACGFLRIVLPPAFTATLLAHVPIFIAMFISPWSALFTTIGTAVGFFLTGNPIVVTARAASHIVFAAVGAYMIKKNINLVLTGITVTLIHAFFEALTVYLFLTLGLTSTQSSETFLSIAFYTTGIGTIIHSTIDYVIAVAVSVPLVKVSAIPGLPRIF